MSTNVYQMSIKVYQFHILKVYQKSTKKRTHSVTKVYSNVFNHTVGMWLCSKLRARVPSWTASHPCGGNAITYTFLHFC